jgi:ubiquinone/menaquinone biosynthesis C-methylase UbiE
MKKYIIGWIVLKLMLLGVLGLFVFDKFPSSQFAQVAEKATPTPKVETDKIDRPTSDPFKGDLSRYERENRADRLQIERVMDLLEITEGKNVADIGAGGGWFSAIAAKRVGEKGKIYAVDINEDAIKYINERKEKEKLINIEAVLGKTDDPILTKKSIDAVLILNTYHEIAEPIIYLKNLKPSLKKNAHIGIIDRDGNGENHGIDKEIIIKEAKQAGFSLKEQYDFVEDSMDYFLIFQLDTLKSNDRKKLKNQQ